MKQKITRDKKWSLDTVFLHNELTTKMKEDVTAPPPEGVYIHGLFIDGASWDRRACRLAEPAPKVLFTSLPVAWVYAINEPKDLKSLYVCPVYKKPRRTDLTYIFPLLLQSGKADPEHWILRGVALLCDTK
jgi:dynein heavy chain